MTKDRSVTPERPLTDDADSTFVEPTATADVSNGDAFGRDERQIADESDDESEAPATVEDRLLAVEDVLRSRGFMR
jgi:hypothetical protein